MNGPLYELHFLSVVALIGTFLLYFFLYALTAPVPGPTRQWPAVVAAIILAVFFLWGLAKEQPTPKTEVRKHSHWGPWVKRFFLFFTCFIAAVFVYSVCKDRGFIKLAFAFPAIASILVVLTFFVWALSTLSFFFDRYRVPVLLSALFLIFVPKWTPLLCWGTPDLEHYFEVEDLHHPLPSIPSPAEAVAWRFPDPAEPAIIVTAAGGGIQAAFWTSQIMARLEADFANDPDLRQPNPQAAQATPYTFHDHLLLASGVSGGSLGLMPYLLEYTAPDGTGFPNAAALRARLTNPSQCSSLEAVAWGLSYYDLDRLLLTYGRSGSRPFDGRLWPVDTDRSWALGQAFNRNLNDYHCDTWQKTYDNLLQQERTRNPALPASLPTLNNGNSFSLSEAATRLHDRRMPAFTFNTTVAETGGRFLLSNYHVPPMKDPPLATSDFLPAESFLQAYAQDPLGLLQPAYADLALSTAARLSATFPYISSGARIHRHFAPHAFHFLDGGYFDNDGTASVIEFLHSALGCRVGDQGCPLPTSPTQPPLAQPSPRNILLIEIRDGSDIDPTNNQDDLRNQNSPDAKDWGTFSQLTGPLLGMWNAGHISVSRRNRRELSMLEKAYADRLHLRHVVFTIPPDGDRIDPLNWHLTERQRKYVEACAASPLGTSACAKATNDAVTNAIRWVKRRRSPAHLEDSEQEIDVCHTAPPPK